VSTVLQAVGLSVRFGGVHAVEDVDVTVEEGQLVGLIGPNGAGKTTFVDAITGFVRYTGRVELDGRDVTGMAPHARARRGLARTWQSTELFDDLTVQENLTVAAERPSFLALAAELVGRRVGESAAAADALEVLGLGSIADAVPEELTQDSGSSWAWRARSQCARGSCASTSRPPGSTRTRARTSVSGFAGSRTPGRPRS